MNCLQFRPGNYDTVVLEQIAFQTPPPALTAQVNCANAYAAASHADAWLAEHFQKQNAQTGCYRRMSAIWIIKSMNRKTRPCGREALFEDFAPTHAVTGAGLIPGGIMPIDLDAYLGKEHHSVRNCPAVLKYKY